MSLGDLLSPLGVFVGVIAAWYAKKAFDAVKSAGDLSDRRRQNDTRPQPRVGKISSIGEWGGSTDLSNVGGACVYCLMVVHQGQSIWCWVGSLSAHCPPHPFPMKHAGIAATQQQGSRVVVALAKDIDGAWWDCLRDTRLTLEPAKWLESQKVELSMPFLNVTFLPGA